MPAQYRPRSHEQKTARGAGQVAGRGCKQRPISHGELRPRDLPAQDLKLVAQHQ
jgi:hypothetical protein